MRQQKLGKPNLMSTRDLQIPAWLEHEHAIIDTMQAIEQSREAMQNAAKELATLVEQDPRGEWQEKWQRFINAGGVTVDEFCRWLVQDRQIRRTNRREHLRLIASSAPPRERDKNKTSIPRVQSRRAPC